MYRSASYHSWLALLILLFVPSLCHCWPAQVVSVSDGDTLTVLHDGRQEKIRLYGVDSPEKDQEFGQKAKEIAKILITGRNVDVTTMAKDLYGRTVGLVSVDGQSLNEMLIQNGFAWVYRQYCKERFCSAWLGLEERARQQKKGLWAGSNIVPPWEWRHQPTTAKKSTDGVPLSSRSDTALGDHRSTGEGFKCDGRTRCSQMNSCEEAKFFLKNCPGAKMDGDNDGVPCEKQCR